MDKNSHKTLCKHNEIKGYFCINCGNIVYENIDTVKPSKYHYKREVCPLRILENMKKLSSEIEFSEIKKKVDYLLKRENIIKLINYVVHKNKYRSQTFYLACYLTDLIMMLEEDDLKVELVAVSALVLTVKFDEIDSVVPDLSFLKSMRLGKIKIKCEIEEILMYEIACLKKLKYNINFYTPYHFLNYFFSNGIVFKDEILKTYDDDIIDDCKLHISEYDKLYDIAKETLFLFVEGKIMINLEEDYLYYSSLDIACSCIAFARSNFFEVIWDQRLATVYNIQLDDFYYCYETISNVYQRKKQYRKQSLKEKMQISSNYLTNLPALNNNMMPKLNKLHSILKEEVNQNFVSRETSRKPGLRQKNSKYSLEPISRHKNILETSRDKKPLHDYNKIDKYYEKMVDNKSAIKLEKIYKNTTNNIYKTSNNVEKHFIRQLSVNKQKKPVSSQFNNINIIPFLKNDYTSEANYKKKYNEDNPFDENIINKTKKLLLTKENFDKFPHDPIHPKSKNSKIELSSKYPSNSNILGIANKINYNANYSKNMPNINSNVDYQKLIEKNTNLSNNIPKYINSSKKRDSSKNKELINFNTNFNIKKMSNAITSITSLNNSNEKTSSHHDPQLTQHNILPSKRIDFEGISKINSKINDDHHTQLKEMPIPSSNLYSGKANYSRIQSGYKDLKYRSELSKREEIYISHIGSNN